MLNRRPLLATLISAALLSGLALTATPSAQAAQSLSLIAEESFDYTGNLAGKNGGTGFTTAWDGYTSYDYGVETPGLSYSGLTTSGGKIYGCTATPNQYCLVSRQVETQTSGVVFFQFLANFGAQNGAGTPNIRFKDGSNNLLAAVGSNGGSQGTKVSILDNTLTAKGDGTGSAGTLNALNFVVLRFDYTNNKTSMWINPNLATFSYFTPPTADAEFENLAPQFRSFEIISRTSARATFDEIKIYKITGRSAAEEAQAEATAKIQREEARIAGIKAAREKIYQALSNKQSVTTTDLAAADLPLKSTASMISAYQDLMKIKDSLKSPISSEESYQLKYDIIMKYALIERLTGISNEKVNVRDLVKYQVISNELPMKSLIISQLMKEPTENRDSMEKVNLIIGSYVKAIQGRKARIKSHLNMN